MSVLSQICPDVRLTCECLRDAEIVMIGYAEGRAPIHLCRECALQLARKLLEDVCDVATKGGRYG